MRVRSLQWLQFFQFYFDILVHILKGNIMKTLIAPLFVSALFASASAFAVTTSDNYGEAVHANASQRTIVIDSNTRYINVSHGETVTLRDGDTTAVWFFDGLNGSFPLSKILPSAAGDKPVQVYVAPKNPD